MVRKFRVSFYLRSNHTGRDGKQAIITRLYLNNERVTLGSTGCSIDPKIWDGLSCRARGRSAEAQSINCDLNRIEADLQYIFRRYEFSEKLSLDFIKAEYLGNKDGEESDSFMDFFDKFIAMVKEEVGITRCEASHQKFNVLKKHFQNFLLADYRRKDIMMGEMNFKLVSDFEHYLLTAGGCQHNTVMRMMGNFKTVTLRAMKLGYLKQDIYANYKIHFNRTDRGFLTEDEIQTLMEKEFGVNRLEVVRDIFLFSCFTGLAYIDVAQLTENHIKVLDGREWIMTKRQKTNVPSNILLLDVPKAIITKYRGIDRKGRLLPILSNQKMNSYLKEIGDLCGFDKSLTFHLARHTFATLALTKGVPIESVSKMLGHTNIRTTQIYARITNKKIEHDMLELASKLDFDEKDVRKANTPPPPQGPDRQKPTEQPKKTVAKTSAMQPMANKTEKNRVNTPQKEDAAPTDKRGPGRPEKSDAQPIQKRGPGRPRRA